MSAADVLGKSLDLELAWNSVLWSYLDRSDRPGCSREHGNDGRRYDHFESSGPLSVSRRTARVANSRHVTLWIRKDCSVRAEQGYVVTRTMTRRRRYRGYNRQ